MRLVPLLCALLLLLPPQPARAGAKSVIFYLDGARIEQEVVAPKGYLEHPLPDSLVPGSLRVKPLGRGDVLRVEVVPPEQDWRRLREIARLEERKSELQDRMQGLLKREEIFSTAARSQSGKSPRKSKANPDPLSSLQQGTRFALAQLEAVQQSQRKCRRAIDVLDRKLARARKGTAFARIWLSGRKARLSYLVASDRWSPSYDFRWDGDGNGELLLHAKLPKLERGVRYLVSQGTVAQGQPPRAVQGEFPTVSRHALVLQGAPALGHPPFSFSFSRVEAALPPGEAAAFWRGEYLGSGRFSGEGASQLMLGSK